MLISRLLLGLSVLAAVTQPALAQGLPSTPPDHVVIVIMENHSAGQIIGSSNAPYINSLANGGANMGQSFAISHPSEPNYLAFFSGSTQGLASDACPLTYSGDNLGAQLIAAGKSFAAYSEDLPSVGYTGCTSGAYARKHAPWVNFTNVPGSTHKPFTAFPTDFTQLPTLSFVIPNLNNDMHDGTVNDGDVWLQTHLDAYAQWARTHNSLLIITFDEDDNSSANQIATIFYGPMVKTGVYNEHINHYYVLRTLEDLYHLPYAGNASTASTITDIWQGPTSPSITSQPSNASVVVGQTATFAVTASGAVPLAYQWRKNGAVISGATSASYTTPAVTSSDNGAVFSVVVSNSVGSVTSNNATLTVTSPVAPSITTQPSNVTVNAGQTATFSVVASGTAPLSYQWSKNGVSISGATSASYTTPATTTGDSGSTFSVTVSNTAGGVTSNNATLTVNPITGSFTEVEPNNTIASANAVPSTVTSITGNLTVSTDVDYFAVTLAAGEKITVNMSGPAGPDWDLYLVNGAGSTLASSTGGTTTESMSYTNAGSASLTAYIKVIVYNGTSSTPYTLALSRVTPPPAVTFNEVEPNDSLAAANTVADDVTKIVGYISSASDNDYFKLSVPAGHTLKVNMTGPTGSAYDYDLYFYNTAGTQLAASEGSTTTESASWTNSGSTAATVVVSVQRYAGSSTAIPYNLVITR